MKRIIIVSVSLIFMCFCVAGAEEAVATSNSWMPVIGELAGMVLAIVGPALTIVLTAVAWKLLSKFGVERNVAIDALMRTYIKQGINYADSWAGKQQNKPVGNEKMVTAIQYVLKLVANSKLPTVAEDKLKEMVEAQLSFDKKQDTTPEVKPAVINE